MQANFNLKGEEHIVSLINASYYIAYNNTAFILDFVLYKLNNVELGKNYWTDKYFRLFINNIATEMESEFSNITKINRFCSF